MAFIPAVNTAKLVAHFTWAGQLCVQTLWFQFNDVPEESDLLALCEHYFDNFWSGIKSTLATNITLTSVEAIRQTEEGDISASYVPSSGNVGTGTGDSVALNDAWVMSFRTARRGRSFRGRNYLPGFLQSILVSPGTGSSTVIADVAAVFVQHFLWFPLTGWTWVVASHYANKAARATAVLTPILTVLADTALDSQRRRLLGRGT